MLGLLIAGSVIVVTGLLSIAFGIPIKEFSLGNILIVSGVIGACTGAVLIAIAMVVRELKAIALALGGAVSVAPRSREQSDALAAQRAALAATAIPETGLPGEEAAAQQPSWQPESEGSPQAATAEPRPAEPAAPVKKRRNLLFMSSRRDRPQGPAAATQEAGAEELPTAESAAAPNVTFEDAWPAAERGRPEAPRQPSMPVRPAEPGGARSPAPPPVRRPAEAQPVTVLKSGVVDGMAYSLYSDGSIEAQLPEGMIRFASIDELRNHLDQRG